MKLEVAGLVQVSNCRRCSQDEGNLTQPQEVPKVSEFLQSNPGKYAIYAAEAP